MNLGMAIEKLKSLLMFGRRPDNGNLLMLQHEDFRLPDKNGKNYVWFRLVINGENQEVYKPVPVVTKSKYRNAMIDAEMRDIIESGFEINQS